MYVIGADIEPNLARGRQVQSRIAILPPPSDPSRRDRLATEAPLALSIIADKLCIEDMFLKPFEWSEIAANLNLTSKSSSFAQGLAREVWRNLRRHFHCNPALPDLVRCEESELRVQAMLLGLPTEVRTQPETKPLARMYAGRHGTLVLP